MTHIVNKAIIMAAGNGTRLRPLTYQVPKPLLKVNGMRMIDSAVSALRFNGITEIYVVVGYLKEQFYEWGRGMPGIHFVENPYYDQCNNISSLYVARELLGDCMILDGDQIICNPAVLDPTFELSGYNAVWCEGETDEWLLDVEGGVIKSCSRSGGSCGWQLYSVSRWTAEDGKKLKSHIEQEFESGNRSIYWDDVAMFCHFPEYTLCIREMQKEDVLEIDSLDELIRADGSYREYLLTEMPD